MLKKKLTLQTTGLDEIKECKVTFNDNRMPMIGKIVERGEKHIRLVLRRHYNEYKSRPLICETKYLLTNTIFSIKQIC